MKITLLLPELKVFIRAVNALGRLGDELYFECGAGSLSLRCVNSSRSAFAAVSFDENFFEKAFDFNTSNSMPLFKLASKTFCKVFKLSLSIDKVVQKCKLCLDNESNVLIVQLFQRHGIVKTYNLSTNDCESLEAIYNINEANNYFCISAKLVAEILNNFRLNQTEISLLFQEGESIFRNFIDDSDLSTVVTHVPVSSSEFSTYHLNNELELTFCQKDMRAAISFGESTNSPLLLHCSSPGKPLIITYSDDKRFKANFVLATLPSTNHPKKSNANVSQFNSSNVKDAPISTSKSDHTADTQPALSSTVAVVPTPLPSKRDSNVQTASTPLSIHCDNVTKPQVKKARSVLFSRLSDSSFTDTPLPGAGALIDPSDSQDDENERTDTFIVKDVPLEHFPGVAQKRCAPSVAATTGWCTDDPSITFKSSLKDKGNNATLLVADSDEDA